MVCQGVSRRRSQFELGPPELQRWYILIIFSMSTAMQANNWLVFSSVPDQVEEYYHLEHPAESGQVNPTIDMLLQWGAIMYLPVAPIGAYILSYPITGLQTSVRTAVTLQIIYSLIRCLPSILDSIPFINYSISNNFWHTLVFLHSAQIIRGFAGPFLMGSPSKLSVIWFPEHQRTTATSIASTMNIFGCCIGFLLGPLIVSTASDVPKLLYVDFAMTLVPALCILIYFPEAPSRLPTEASRDALLSIPVRDAKSKAMNDDKVLNEALISDDVDVSSISLKEHLNHFAHEMVQCVCDYSTIMVLICGAMFFGIFSAWTGVLQDMMSWDFSDTQIGVMGFILNFMVAVGGVTIGNIADRCFARRLRRLMIIIFTVTLMVLAALLVLIPNPIFADALLDRFDLSNFEKNVILDILVAVMGLCYGGLVPLFFELSAEVSYPVSAGSTGMLLMFLANSVLFVFTGMGSWLNTEWETSFAIVMCGLCVVLLCTIKEEYKRK